MQINSKVIRISCFHCRNCSRGHNCWTYQKFWFYALNSIWNKLHFIITINRHLCICKTVVIISKKLELFQKLSYAICIFGQIVNIWRIIPFFISPIFTTIICSWHIIIFCHHKIINISHLNIIWNGFIICFHKACKTFQSCAGIKLRFHCCGNKSTHHSLCVFKINLVWNFKRKICFVYRNIKFKVCWENISTIQIKCLVHNFNCEVCPIPACILNFEIHITSRWNCRIVWWQHSFNLCMHAVCQCYRKIVFICGNDVFCIFVISQIKVFCQIYCLRTSGICKSRQCSWI